MADDNARDPTYFSYYAQFVHQQNMLQDSVRTSMYQNAILSNSEQLFAGKAVMDLGAGSGILSYFAVKAGASHVFAVEASNMADNIKKLMNNTATKNTWLQGKVTVIKEKIEDVKSAGLVDTLISEPIGVLLVHERMIESYLVARDRFLKPGGFMIPSMGNIYVAPFSDAGVWSQTMAKVRFWEQRDFHGVDFSPLANDAKEEVFGQPIVGTFDPRCLLSPASAFTVDFRTISQQELQDILIPFTWVAQFTGLIHGIAAWFDINLGGYILSTAPHAEKTHWHQVAIINPEPLAVNAFETINGWMRMKANSMRSYDITAEIGSGTGAYTARQGKWALHEQTYYFEQYASELDQHPENFGLYEK